MGALRKSNLFRVHNFSSARHHLPPRLRKKPSTVHPAELWNRKKFSIPPLVTNPDKSRPQDGIIAFICPFIFVCMWSFSSRSYLEFRYTCIATVASTIFIRKRQVIGESCVLILSNARHVSEDSTKCRPWPVYVRVSCWKSNSRPPLLHVGGQFD